MAQVINGRFDAGKGYFSWEESIYYDDIDHTNTVHHAYYLRFFEHAREHMLGQRFLPSLLQSQNTIIVAVKTDQKHADFSTATLGDKLEIRTKVQTQGEYRIIFNHEAWRTSVAAKEKDIEECAPLLVVSGSVEMVCLDAEKLSVVPLPEEMTKEMMIMAQDAEQIGQQAKPKRVLRKPSRDASKSVDWLGVVNDFDTDFTNVVYQAKYLQYYEQARKAFLREAECLALLEHNGCFSAVYKAQVNFKSPLGPDETFRVKTRVKVDGRFRLEFNQEIETLETGEQPAKLVNSAEIQVICISKATRKMVEFPSELHRALSRVLEQAS